MYCLKTKNFKLKIKVVPMICAALFHAMFILVPNILFSATDSIDVRLQVGDIVQQADNNFSRGQLLPPVDFDIWAPTISQLFQFNDRVVFWWRSERPASVQAIAEVVRGPQRAHTKFYQSEDRSKFGFIMFDSLTAGSDYQARFLFVDRYDEYVILRKNFSTGDLDFFQSEIVSNDSGQIEWIGQELPPGWYWRVTTGPFADQGSENPSPWQGQVIYEGVGFSTSLPDGVDVSDVRLFATDGQAYAPPSVFDMNYVQRQTNSEEVYMVNDDYVNYLLFFLILLLLVITVRYRSHQI